MKCPKCDSINTDVDSLFCKKCATSLTGDVVAQSSFTKTLETPSKDIGPGTTFASRYKVIEELGRGGMGIVYKAKDTKLKRMVAIKLLPPKLTGDKEARERFIREAQSAAVLDHPNICTIYEVDESEDKTFISMAYVDGQNLREMVKAGPLEINEGLDLGIQSAEGLAAAHSKGIVHRDIKSANIMVTKHDQAKIMDFGLAKFVGASLITREGVTMGTVAYMSPEQAQGKAIDHRSDIWSLGVVLYEIFCGRLPFRGESEASFLYSIVHEDPVPLKEVNPDIPIEIQRVITRALKKKPDARYQSAEELVSDLKHYQGQVKVEEAGLFNLHTLLRRLRQPKLAIPILFVLIFITAAIILYFNRQAKIRWAKEVAIPEIQQRFNAEPIKNAREAFVLALEAEKYIPQHPQLKELISAMSNDIAVESQPSDAEVFIKNFPTSPEDDWEKVGVTSIEKYRIPIGFYMWKFEKEGYETITVVDSSFVFDKSKGVIVGNNISRTLDKQEDLPPRMVRVGGRGKIKDFFIDKYEVTNRDFKDFIDRSGYENQDYWNYEFKKEGRRLSWDEAMAEFKDLTGRPGPSSWKGGSYPVGEADYPVSGISWYEAVAFAEFSGKNLPTVSHWEAAAGLDLPSNQFGMTTLAIPASNFNGKGPKQVGSHQHLSAYGAHDMAGNLREWCLNESQSGRCIRGGAWDDIPYLFTSITGAPEFDRSYKNGVRCVKYLASSDIDESLVLPKNITAFRNFEKEQPVNEEVFQLFKQNFMYDQTELNEKIENLTENSDWKYETISFDAAYDNERMTVHLFLPKSSSPPYQTVVFFPGGGATARDSSQNIEEDFQFINYNAFIVRNGRAVLFPVYKGTYERRVDLPYLHHLGDKSFQYRDYLTKVVKDFRRSIDYLYTRSDIDLDSIAYMGFSWGGFLGSIIPAVEDRLNASVLLLGGFMNRDRLPEVDEINYVSRVRTPTLMLNARYDPMFVLEEVVWPMYRLLGTSDKDKDLKIYETDHYIPFVEIIRETLNWLDKYLGPVNK